ncbi:MAG TPA: IS5/IS1182 family transposase, partial [Gammaproteobacteria bacterium]|nr:IS5/IS1182 family transposase [Gammaproteobacteria bacterium]
MSLLNEARQFSEQIIDRLYQTSGKRELGETKKPRTYRVQARTAYLAIVQQRRPGSKVRQRGIKQQLQYLRRNLGHIHRLLEHRPLGKPLPLPRW